VDNKISVDLLLAQLPHAPVQSAILKRKAQWWVFLVAAGISFVTGLMGFIEAFQQPDKQLVAGVLLAIVIVLLAIRMFRAKRRRHKHITHVPPHAAIVIVQQLSQQLTTQSRLSARQIMIGRSVRVIDNIAWVLLAVVLTIGAGAIFVLSAFGLYEAIRTELSIFDVVLLIGLVRPLSAVRSGVKNWLLKSAGARRRINTLSESLHYVIESANQFIEKLGESTTEVLRASTTAVSRVGGSMATTASTVALSVTVSGMGLASAHVAPSAVIATGQVIPLPPVIANMAGPAGHEVAMRGAVFYGCMGNILDSNQHTANEDCQQAVQQANDSCAGWQGGPLPPECAQAITQVLPQAVENIQSTLPPPPVDGANSGNPPPADPNRSLPNNQPPPLNGTPQPQDPNQPGNPPPNGAQAPCVAQDPNTQCAPPQSTANPAQNNNNGYPAPANPNDPKGTPGPNLTPGGQQNPPPQTTNVAPPPQTTNVPPPQTTNVPPPQTTNVPPPQTTNVPPPQTTNVPPPQTTNVPPPQATSAPAPQATAKPQPTTKPPPPPPPPRP
jgi:hypothetical protein